MSVTLSKSALQCNIEHVGNKSMEDAKISTTIRDFHINISKIKKCTTKAILKPIIVSGIELKNFIRHWLVEIDQTQPIELLYYN